MLITQKRLVDFLSPHARFLTIADIRIGLGYCAVLTSNGHAGLAWTPKSNPGCCTHFKGAGTLKGRPAEELLAMLVDKESDLVRAVGLATANALLAAFPHPQTTKEDVVSLIGVTAADRVAMVGYFAPVANELRLKGCKLDIIEIDRSREGTLPPEEGGRVLEECTVAIITGTSLVTGTCDNVLAGLGRPRAAVLLGPSSPLCRDVFKETKITHVGGAVVRNVEGVLRVVSEGGGTPLLKAHVSFEALSIR